MKDLQYIGGYRHPKNPYDKINKGEHDLFYKEEYRLYDCTHEEYWAMKKKVAPKCPVCGEAKGFSFGTGDCDCGAGYV